MTPSGPVGGVADDKGAGPITIRDAGAVAIGGAVSLTGGVVAGRDLTISHLTVIADDAAPSGDAVGRPGQATDVCPYPGIAAFGDDHNSFFFGRDRDVAAVVGLLARANLVAVVGSSGSGKSSLLAAGVIPALRRGGLPGSAGWRVEPLRPGVKPFDQLAARLSARPGGVNFNQVVEALRADPSSFGRLAREMSEAEGAPVLWVIDQFEEVFDDDVDAGDRTGFFSALVAAASNGTTVRVLLAMRSDFYPDLDVHRRLADAVAAHQHRLVPLDKDAITDVIVRPAEQVGLRVEPALVAEILKEVEPSANLLPLLAYALQQTWRRRRNGWLTVAGYIDTGGVSGALEQGAERVWAALSPTERETGRRILLRLAHVTEVAAPTRRRALARDLITEVDAEATVVAVVGSFAAARLLTVDVEENSGQATVEVTHESLLREWSLLRSWLLGDRDARRVQQDLADSAASWDGHGRDQAYLFQGGRLKAVDALQARGDLALNQTELRFVRASRKLDTAQKRRSRLLIALPLGLAVVLVFAGMVVVQQRQTAQQKVVAEALQVSAEARSVLHDQRDLGLLLSLAALDINDNATTRSTLLDAGTATDGPIAFATVPGSRANAIASTLAPDGSVVAGAADGTIRLFSPADGHETTPALTGHRDALTAVAVSPSGIVVSGAADGQVLVHRLSPPSAPAATAGAPEFRLRGATSSIRAIVVDRGGATVAAATSDGLILRWQLPSADPVVVAQVPGPISSLALVETGRQLVTVSGSGDLRRWRLDSGEPLPSLLTTATSLRGGPDVRLVAAPGGLVAVDGDRAYRWDLTTDPVTSSVGDPAGATAVAVTPDGSLTVVGGGDGGVTSWVTTPRPLPIGTPRGGLNRRVDGLATDGTYVVGLDASGRIVSWYLAGRRSPLGVKTASQSGAAVAVAFAPDGTLASAGTSGRIIVSGPGRPTVVLTVASGLSDLAWLANGTIVVSGRDGSVRQLDATTGAERLRAPPSGPPVVGLATGAGNTVAWVTATGVVVIDGPSGRRQLQAQGTPVTAFALSADSRFAAVGTGDASRATVTMWSLADQHPTAQLLRGHRLKVTGLAFSPDGKTLASGSDDTTIRLWSVPSGRPLGQLLGHTDMVIALAFSANGKMLASGGEDETVAIWDVPGRRQIGRMNYGGVVWSLAVSPDGKEVASGQGSEVIRWPFGVPAWAARACAFAHRELTPQEWARYAPGRPRHRLCTTGTA